MSGAIAADALGWASTRPLPPPPMLSILLLATVPLVATPDPPPQAATLDERPNVLVILTDDQGWGDIGYNNPEAVHTPHLDRLAAGGARLTQHYVMPQCTPTRVAAFTGRFPSRFGPQAQQASNRPVFPKGTPTLATMLRASGYDTHLVGKWHMGSDPEHGPNHFGFDTSYGSLAGAIGMYDHRYRKGRFAETWHRDHEVIDGWENGRHATDLTADEAVRVVRAERDAPFFLYLAFHAPHTPLDERGPFVDRPTQLDPDDPTRWLGEDEIPWFHDPEGKIQAEPDPEKRLLLATIHHLDHAIGRVVEALEATGQLANTLILFSSDNGPQGSWGGNAYPDDLKLTDFNQPIPYRGKKCDVWEGGIRVPGLVHWPARVEPRVVDAAVHVVDWFPTLAALLGHAPDDSAPWDGIDLAPVLFADGELPARDLYWTWSVRTNRWALRHGDWKLVHYGTDEPDEPADWQLYDLARDPAEERDLAAEHPDRLAALHARFLALRAGDAKTD